MIDLSFIGKDGLIIQYEDIISLIGLNVLLKKIEGVSVEDTLKSYITRDTENVATWLNNKYNIGITDDMISNSIMCLKPNNMFAYKMFDTAERHMLRNLIIYSNIESKHIEEHVKSSFSKNVNYISGIDITKVIECFPNSTYVTSNCDNIRKCKDISTPVMLSIIDD